MFLICVFNRELPIPKEIEDPSEETSSVENKELASQFQIPDPTFSVSRQVHVKLSMLNQVSTFLVFPTYECIILNA